MSVTSECLTDDSGSTGGEIVTNVNSFDYGLLPRLPLFPPLDVRYGNKVGFVCEKINYFSFNFQYYESCIFLHLGPFDFA